VPQLSAHHLGRIEVALHSAASVFTTSQRISAPSKETGHFIGCIMVVESCRLWFCCCAASPDRTSGINV